MKIKVGILKSKIETDNPELLRALCSVYSFKIPGVEYSAAYKRRQGWDGKKKFISKNGTFGSGLLYSILENLKEIGCIPYIEQEYEDDLHLKIKEIDNFSYYDFQYELIRKSLSEKRGIVKAPTGSGKTLIMAGIIKSLLGKKMVVLFNAKQLLKQTYEFLTETCGLSGIGICFGEGYIQGDIMLCTVQSIEKILDTHLEASEVLLIDECHEFSKGKTTLAAIQSFPNAKYRIGFTATPPKEKIPKYNLESALGRTWQVVETLNLVEQGKLTKPIIQLINREYDASGLDSDMDYSEIYDTYIVNNQDRNNTIKEIVNEIRRNQDRARILILTKSLDHGRALENLLGESCQFLEGANSIGERYKAISRFRGCEKSSVLIGTKILQTGINIEEITHFINARGMKSEIATLQALGRALRRHDSKEIVYIYDFMDKERYLVKHSKSRKKYYLEEGHKVEIL